MRSKRLNFGNQFLLLFNIWMVVVALSKVILIFPHWKISVIALLNYDLYFLVALLALSVYLKGRYNKYIFLNLAIFALIYFLGFLTIFIGKDYSLGSDLLQYYIWVYRKIVICIITCVTVIYIPIDYLYHEKKTITKYLLTLVIILPISFLYYKNFFLSYKYLFIDNNYMKVFPGILGMNFLALFFIGLYGYLLFYRDKPISGHINLVVFSFLIFLSIDSIDNLFNYIGKSLPTLSHLFLVGNLILFVLILAHNLFYLSTEFGKFYEDIRFSKINLNIKILRRTTLIEQYVMIIQKYFHYLPNRFYFVLLMIISLSLFVYFYPYGYAKLGFLILLFIMLILLGYLNMLIKKRIKSEVKLQSNKTINSLTNKGRCEL